MIIQLNDILEIPGKTKTCQAEFEGDKILSYPVKESVAGPLEIRHKKDRTVEIQGSLRLVLQIPCDRCLKPVDTLIETDIRRTVDLTTGRDEEDEPVSFSGRDHIDTELLFEEAALENLPMKVLCREDCKGLCPVCGADLNEGPCSCQDTKAPTRMQEALMKAFQNAERKK